MKNMARALFAIVILCCAVFLGTAFGRKKPAEIIPELAIVAKGGTIGVNCDAGQMIVGLEDCQDILDTLREDLASLPIRVVNCPDTLDRNGELSISCAGGGATDLLLSAGKMWGVGDDYQDPPLLVDVSAVSSGKVLWKRQDQGPDSSVELAGRFALYLVEHAHVLRTVCASGKKALAAWNNQPYDRYFRVSDGHRKLYKACKKLGKSR